MDGGHEYVVTRVVVIVVTKILIDLIKGFVRTPSRTQKHTHNTNYYCQSPDKNNIHQYMDNNQAKIIKLYIVNHSRAIVDRPSRSLNNFGKISTPTNTHMCNNTQLQLFKYIIIIIITVIYAIVYMYVCIWWWGIRES